MTDRPILFSAPMVRALLNGSKTQTRRVLKPQPSKELPIGGADFVVQGNDPGRWCWLSGFDGSIVAPFEVSIRPRYRLWVRETWRVGHEWDDCAPRALSKIDAVHYEADGDQRKSNWGDPFDPGKTRVSIHMPRWASRLTLTVRDVRVERLQDISYSDIRAEGIAATDIYARREADCRDRNIACGQVARDSFRELWNSINSQSAWDQNPWVAAYTFTVEQRNIDAPRPFTPEVKG